jgi:hypothetical protein
MLRRACLFLLFLAGCSASRDLTPDQLTKLDARLQMLLSGGASQPSLSELESSLRPDGAREYAVVIRGGSVEELRKEGIPAMGGIGAVATARVTLEELRSLARISSVRSVETAKTVYPNK